MFFNKKQTNGDYKILYVIITAFLIRLTYVTIFAPNKIEIPSGDAIGYNKIATNILLYREISFEKDKPTAHREPLYPIFLALIYIFFGQSLLVVRIFQSIVGIFSVYFIFLISKKVFGKNIGLISSIIASVYPNFVYYTAVLLRETLFLFLLLVCVYFTLKVFDEEKNLVNQVLLGIFFSLVALVNSVGIVLFFGYLIFFILINFGIKKVMTIFIVFSLIYSIWIFRNYKVFGQLVFCSTNGGKTFWDGTDIIPFEVRGLPEEERLISINPTILYSQKISSEIERDKFFYRETIKYIKNNPVRYFKLVIKKYIKFWRFFPYMGRNYGNFSTKLISVIGFVTFFPIFCFFIISLFCLKKVDKKQLLILTPVIVMPIVYSIFWSQIRYRIPIEPYLIIFAVYGFFSIFKLNKNDYFNSN